MRSALLLLALGCAPGVPEPEPRALPFPTDTARAEALGPGVTHRYFWSPTGPWAIHVLAVDLDRCYSLVAVKGAAGVVGREKTSVLLEHLNRTETVIGGVNADFFLFTPPGVPQSALISAGRVLSGPSPRPVLAVDSGGALHVTTLRTEGVAVLAGFPQEIHGWNRSAPDGLSLFDSGWGAIMDTASGAVEVVLHGRSPSVVALVDTTPAGSQIPADGAVLFAPRGAPDPMRAALLALRPGDTVRVTTSLAPWHPREAVGGTPVLLRDGAPVAGLDSAGRASFAASRHPRTAVGLARGGRRVLLVVVDGRQKPYSDGMTLRELADLLLALGARDALNLDGGGSTTMVRAAPGDSRLEIVNRPSDPQGERPVGDAIAVVRGCGRP
jgi:phosphodiester glycosidase